MAVKNIVDSIIQQTADLSQLLGADLQDADLQDARLQGANLQGADLRGANLEWSDLRMANLQEAKLQEASLRGADLREADLREADLRRANLEEAKLMGANLREAYLREADLREADLRGADLRGADMRGANLRGADPQGVRLTNAVVNDQTVLNLPSMYEILDNRIIPKREEPPKESPQEPLATQELRGKSAAEIGSRLAEKPVQYARDTEDITSLLEAQIAWWESKKPNQHDEEWKHHYDLLLQTRDGLRALTAQIRELENQSTPEKQEAAGEQTLSLLEKLNTFIKDYSNTITANGKNAAIFSMILGTSTGLTFFTGANPNLVVAITTAAIGGPDLVKVASGLLSKKDKSEDKPSE